MIQQTGFLYPLFGIPHIIENQYNLTPLRKTFAICIANKLKKDSNYRFLDEDKKSAREFTSYLCYAQLQHRFQRQQFSQYKSTTAISIRQV